MPDDLMPNLPMAVAPRPWLARYRKVVIMGGAVLVVVAAGVAVTVSYRSKRAQPRPNNTAGSNTATVTNTSSRPTFQRSTVTNVPTTLPPSYRPPSPQDLRQAIDQLNHPNSTK